MIVVNMLPLIAGKRLHYCNNSQCLYKYRKPSAGVAELDRRVSATFRGLYPISTADDLRQMSASSYPLLLDVPHAEDSESLNMLRGIDSTISLVGPTSLRAVRLTLELHFYIK